MARKSPSDAAARVTGASSNFLGAVLDAALAEVDVDEPVEPVVENIQVLGSIRHQSAPTLRFGLLSIARRHSKRHASRSGSAHGAFDAAT